MSTHPLGRDPASVMDIFYLDSSPLKLDPSVKMTMLFQAAIALDEEVIKDETRDLNHSDDQIRFQCSSFVNRVLETIITDPEIEEPTQVLQTLNRCGIDFNLGGEQRGATYLSLPPLHTAVRTNQLGVVQTLLGFNADPNKFDQHGSYPLNHAKKPEIAFALKSAGANPEALSRNGNTPLREALNHLQIGTPGSRENTLALLSIGARVNLSTVMPSFESERTTLKIRHFLLNGSHIPLDIAVRLTGAHLRQNALTYLTTGLALSILPFQALKAYNCATMEEEVPVAAPVDDSFYGRYWASPTAPPTLPPTQSFGECFFG